MERRGLLLACASRHKAARSIGPVCDAISKRALDPAAEVLLGLHERPDGAIYAGSCSALRGDPSGVYLEGGEEVFIGTLDGGPMGTFATTYMIEGKYDATGAEVHGRCQHPIADGSGTGGFTGAKGRVDFKDIIGDPVTYVYRGHISLR